MSASGTMRLVAAEIEAGAQRLTRLPRWVRPDDPEGYWHVPRSAEVRDAAFNAKYQVPRVVVVQFWCDQRRWVVESKLLTEPYDGARRCGTCDGRARGFEREEGLIFSPRSPFDPPKFCPAFCIDREERCPFCGAKPRYRRVHGGMFYDQDRHRIGDGWRSWSPCPRHGWKKARRVTGGRILCADGWGNDCHFEIAKVAHDSPPFGVRPRPEGAAMSRRRLSEKQMRAEINDLSVDLYRAHGNLERYGGHLTSCASGTFTGPGPCDCGWDDVARELPFPTVGVV